jgi:hypothetical protein
MLGSQMRVIMCSLTALKVNCSAADLRCSIQQRGCPLAEKMRAVEAPVHPVPGKLKPLPHPEMRCCSRNGCSECEATLQGLLPDVHCWVILGKVHGGCIQ